MTLVQKPAAGRAGLTAGEIEHRAQAQVAQARALIDTADAPDEVSRAAANAESVRDNLERARQAFGDDAPGLLRFVHEAQAAALDALVKLGERVLERNAQVESRSPVHVDKRMATEFRAPRTKLGRAAELALALRAKPAAWAKARDEALEAGRPIPLGKLRALCPRAPRRPTVRPTVSDDQLAVRVDARLAAALDGARGDTSRAAWVREHLDQVLHEQLDVRLDLHLEGALTAARGLASGDRSWRGVVTALERVGEAIGGRTNNDIDEINERINRRRMT